MIQAIAIIDKMPASETAAPADILFLVRRIPPPEESRPTTRDLAFPLIPLSG
jgi:hypothetical protein